MKKVLWLLAALSACNLQDKAATEQQGAPPVTTAMIAVYNLTTYDITMYLDDANKGIVLAAIHIKLRYGS